MKQILFCLVFFCGGVVALHAGQTRLWFETKSQAEHISVTAYGKATIPGDYQYRLQARRFGQGGRAITSQGGRVAIVRDKATRLARLNLSLAKGEQVQISLALYDAHNLLLKKIEQVLPAEPAAPEHKD